MRIYEVGGSIRDGILGVPTKDRDFAIEAESYEEMRNYFLRHGIIWLEKPEFLTIRGKYYINGRMVDADFVLCRKDGYYSDGRRPDKVEVGTIYDDLARRDFTCNAIAIDVDTGETIDPFNGITDTRHRWLNCVGKTEDRMREDALRMLRAIRFQVTKDFRLSSGIRVFLSNWNNCKLLENISDERIREELLKCFRHDTMKTLDILYLYPHIFKTIFSDTLWLRPTLEEK